jgi:NAD(P)-dependent dehydrogenase (short-subunit alcohol dehydrogenase family)
MEIKKMNIFDLTGKTALITGASSGLGERFSRALSGAGARVILTARRMDRLQALRQELGNAVALEMDVADKNSVRKAFETLERDGEKIDICVNNAGIAYLTPIFEPDESGEFEKQMQTNLMGVWYVTKEVANHMKAHGIQGSIINIGSINGDATPAPLGSAYNVSKAAVLHLTQGLVGELSPHKIRINSISPGFFPTDMTKGVNSEDVINEVIKKIPLGNKPDTSDLDGAILFLAANKASRYTTGSCLTVDGGISWSSLS